MEKCKICFEDKQNGISIFDYFGKEDDLCGCCRRKLIVRKKTIRLEALEVEAIYEYNDELEDMLYRLKESRDVALKDVFLSPHTWYIKRSTITTYVFMCLPVQRRMKNEDFLHLNCFLNR